MATRPDTVVHSHHAHVVGVLAPPGKELVAHEVGAIVDHEHSALHSDGLAAVEHGVQVGAVVAALIMASAKVFVLVEDNLDEGKQIVSVGYKYIKGGNPLMIIQSCSTGY